MSGQLTLTKVYNPMNRADHDTITWEHRPGLTVADLLDHTGARLGMAQRDSLALVVSVNGHVVPASQYTTTTLMPGQHVTMVPVLTGGGGGGKDVLRMIGMVIVAIVAAVVATVAQQYWLYGPIMKTIVGAVVMAAGSLLINAELPPEVL